MLTVIAEIRTRRANITVRPSSISLRKLFQPFLKKRVPRLRADGGSRRGREFSTLAPDSIVMIEQWESVAHLEAHLQTPHMKAYSDAVKTMCWK